MRDLSIIRSPREPASSPLRLQDAGSGSGWQAQDLSALLRMLRAERRRIVAIVVVFAALGALYALTTPRMYTATSSILIDERRLVDEEPPSGGRSLAEIGMDTASIDSQVAVIGSERVAVRVLQRLHLDADAGLAAPTTPLARLAGLAGLLHLAAAEPAQPVGGVPFRILEGFAKRLDVKRQQQTFVIDVGFRDVSPERAARIANEVVAVYADERITESAASKARSLDWLRQRVAEADAEVGAAGKALDARRDAAADVGGELLGQRRLDGARRVYEALVSRMNAAYARQTLPVSAVSVLSDALVPPQASQPKALLCILLGAIAGVCAALGYAFWRASSDLGFLAPSEIEDALGVRILGVIPRFPRLAAWRRHRDAGRAMIALRAAAGATRILAERPCVIAVVSATSGEGRSAVSRLLAEVLVAEGRRVLLVDADVRGPPDAGVAGQRAEPVAVVPGPDVLSIPASSLGIALTPQRMRQILDDGSRAHYDDVVIDLPPLTDLAGPAALAPQIDAFVLAVSWRGARRGFVAEALRASPAVYERVVGALFNGVDLAAMRRSARDHRDALHLAAYPMSNEVEAAP